MLQVLRHKACFMTLAILSFVYIDCRVVRKVHNAGLYSSRQGQNNRGSLFTHAAVCFLYIAGLCLGCLWVIQYIVMQFFIWSYTVFGHMLDSYGPEKLFNKFQYNYL